MTRRSSVNTSDRFKGEKGKSVGTTFAHALNSLSGGGRHKTDLYKKLCIWLLHC